MQLVTQQSSVKLSGDPKEGLPGTYLGVNKEESGKGQSMNPETSAINLNIATQETEKQPEK